VEIAARSRFGRLASARRAAAGLDARDTAAIGALLQKLAASA